MLNKERWAGEKMILIPSLIDETLDRSIIVNTFAKSIANRTYGVVALVPGFKWTKDWDENTDLSSQLRLRTYRTMGWQL